VGREFGILVCAPRYDPQKKKLVTKN